MTQEQIKEKAKALCWLIADKKAELQQIQKECSHPSLKEHGHAGLGSGLSSTTYVCPDCQLSWSED